MDVKDIVAAIGAGLGVFNFWRAFLSDRERITLGFSLHRNAVVIVNRSAFPVTITELRHVLRTGESVDLQISAGNAHGGHAQRIEARDAYEYRYGAFSVVAIGARAIDFTMARSALRAVFTTETRAARWWRRTLETLRFKKRLTAPAGSR